MNKKKILLIGVLSALSVGSVVGISVAASKDGFQVQANGTEVWKHYNAVTPSFTKRGIKEYWVSCSSHESVFTAPATGTIEEGGTPSENFINSLPRHDSRVLFETPVNYDFEGEVDLTKLFTSKSTVSNYVVKDGVGVNGSKGLEVQGFYGDKGLYFSKDYLDAIFVKPEVVALSFDFRADVEWENFRHKSYNHDASGNPGTGPKNITYFHGASGTGLTTFWKTAQFTRAMYDELAENPQFDGGFVIFGTTNDTDHRNIYLDNFKPVTVDAKSQVSKSILFNQVKGSINHSTNDTLIYDSYTNTAKVKIFSADAKVTNVTIDSTYKTEGVGALHIVREASDFNFGIEDDIVDEAISAGYDGITFDIMLDHVVGPANMLKFVNRTSTTQNGYGVYDTYTWYPIKCAFNDIRDTGSYDYLFNLMGAGGDAKQIKNIWIDNIRPYKNTPSFSGTTVLETFEDSNVIKVLNKKQSGELDTVYWESGMYNYSDNGEHEITTLGHDNYRDRNLSNFWFNTARADTVSASRCFATIDSSFAHHGVSSFRLDVTHNDGSNIYAFVPRAVTDSLSDGDKIMIDVYTDVAGQTFGKRNTGGAREGTPLIVGSWTTVEFTKANGDANLFRLCEHTLAKGSYWFDNIRVVKA